MKVSELKGSDLDYWVARATGLKKGQTNYVTYSSSWVVGGPIIERERIGVVAEEDGGRWMARRRRGDLGYTGQTALIAAMRAFVASRFGEEVDDSQAHHD